MSAAITWDAPVDHDVLQGSAEWLALRKQYFAASDAAAMMGQSPYETRAALLARYATGVDKDQSGKAAIFSSGHAAEKAALALAANDTGEDFYPAVMTRRSSAGLSLLASLDGIDMAGDLVFEHKLYNSELADHIKLHGAPPERYLWQLEHQLLVSQARAVLFVVSDGSPKKWVERIYRSDPKRREILIEGWSQFVKELESWTPPAPAVEVIGVAPGALPALFVQITGGVTASNLEGFKEVALAQIQAVNRCLQSDQDFADAEKSIRWCGEVESRLKAAKDHALGQTKSIDDLFRAIDSISAEARAARLELDKLVKSRKDSIKAEIISASNEKLKDHIAKLGAPYAIDARANYDGMKGLKSIDSLRNAADRACTEAIVDATILATQMRENKAALGASGHEFLFTDAAALCAKTSEDLLAIITHRIAQYKDREAKSQAALAEKTTKTEEAAAPSLPPAIASTDAAKNDPDSIGTQHNPRLSQARPSPADVLLAVAKAFSVNYEEALDLIREAAQAKAAET